MIAFLDPYDFVRLVTFALATVWTVRGAWRTQRFLRRWERRFDEWGVERSWLRRCVALSIARATVLDPINLALILVLIGVWTVRASV